MYARFSLGWLQRTPPDSSPAPTNTSQLNGAARLLANHWFGASLFHDVAPGYILALEGFPLPHILLRAFSALASNSKVSLVGRGTLSGHAIDRIEETKDAGVGKKSYSSRPDRRLVCCVQTLGSTQHFCRWRWKWPLSHGRTFLESLRRRMSRPCGRFTIRLTTWDWPTMRGTTNIRPARVTWPHLPRRSRRFPGPPCLGCPDLKK